MSFYHDLTTPATLTPKKRTFTSEQVTDAIAKVRAVIGWTCKGTKQVGSSYILGEGLDLDIVVHVSSLPLARGLLQDAGYNYSSEEYPDIDEETFNCFRKGYVNVMLTEDSDWYWNFIRSADICRAMHLLGLGIDKKAARIAVHRVLMDEESPEEAVKYAKEVAP